MLDELQYKNMYVHKWNKPTKKGTHVTFKAVTSTAMYQEKMDEIISYTKNINSELGTKFEIKDKSESEGTT